MPVILRIFVFVCTAMNAAGQQQVHSMLKILQDYNNVTHIIPLFYHLSQQELPICYYNIKDVRMMELCTVLCKEAGFQHCGRSYSVKLNTQAYPFGKGLSVDVDCTGGENSAGQCTWVSRFKSSCQDTLSIYCDNCNNSLTFIGDQISVVNLPQYSLCQEESACEWNISLQKTKKKDTHIKFQGYKSLNNNEIWTSRIIVISWVDYKQKPHLIRETEEYFTVTDIQIASDAFLMHYYAHNCSRLGVHERLQLVINSDQAPQGYVNEEPKFKLAVLILLLSILITGMATVTICLCYNIMKKSKHQEYNLQALGSNKSLNCLSSMTSPQKDTVDDYLVMSWGKDCKPNEENSEIQLGSVTRYTVNKENTCDHESERKVERSSSFKVKCKLPFTSNQQTTADTAYTVKRPQLYEVPMPANNEATWSIEEVSSEMEPIYSCKSSESEKSCFSVSHTGSPTYYACSEADTFISLSSELPCPMKPAEYGSIQSLK